MPPVTPAQRLLRRALLLGLCVAVGCAVGFTGQYVTGHPAWFLAVPACVVLGWWLVADPASCLPPADPRSRDDSASR